MIRDEEPLTRIKRSTKELSPITHSKVVLDRISDTELVNMFRNQLSYFIKSFQTLFAGSNPSNLQYKLLFNQFNDCLDQYQPYLNLGSFIENVVEVGEHLLEIPGCRLLAKERCFERVIIAVPLEQLAAHASAVCRAKLGILVAKVTFELFHDPFIRTKNTKETINQIILDFQGVAKDELFTKLTWLPFHMVYHSTRLSQLFKNKKRYKEVIEFKSGSSLPRMVGGLHARCSFLLLPISDTTQNQDFLRFIRNLLLE